MRLSRPVAILVGIATLWPVLYIALFMATFFSMFVGVATHEGAPDELGYLLPFLFIGHFGTMLVFVGLMIFYVVHVFKNQTLADDRRILWMIVIFMGSFVAMPVYWYLYVWQSPSPPTPLPSQSRAD